MWAALMFNNRLYCVCVCVWFSGNSSFAVSTKHLSHLLIFRKSRWKIRQSPVLRFAVHSQAMVGWICCYAKEHWWSQGYFPHSLRIWFLQCRWMEVYCWGGIIFVSTHTHVYGPLSGTTRVSRYQKGKTNLDFTYARDSEWQLHQLGRMQVCTSLQTDNHASTHHSVFLPSGCPSCHPTNSVVALKAHAHMQIRYDTRWYFNVRSKADISQVNLPHGTDN